MTGYASGTRSYLEPVPQTVMDDIDHPLDQNDEWYQSSFWYENNISFHDEIIFMEIMGKVLSNARTESITMNDVDRGGIDDR